MGKQKSSQAPKTNPATTINLQHSDLLYLPDNIADLYPELENLNLSDNQLTETAIEPLIRLIHKLPTLKKINLALNPIPPEMLAYFLVEVRQINASRPINQQVVILSEFSVPDEYLSDDAFRQKISLWLLEPVQWKRIQNPYPTVNTISLSLEEDPEQLAIYTASLVKVFNEKCANGWTLFACASTTASLSLIRAAVDYLGPQGFYDAALTLFKEQDIPNFDVSIYGHPYISSGLLYHAKSDELAEKLALQLLPEDSTALEETKGRVAYFRGDVNKAVDHYNQSKQQDSTIGAYLLATTIMYGIGYNNTDYSVSDIITFLEYACTDPSITPEYDLALLYEELKNMPKAYECYQALQQKIIAYPVLALHTGTPSYLGIESRLLFGRAVDVFFEAILKARTTVHLKTYAASFRQEGSAFWRSVSNNLNETVIAPAHSELLQALGLSLLNSFLGDKHALEKLTVHIVNKIENNDEQYRDLLSHDRTKFSQALIESVREFQTHALGGKLKSGWSVAI